VEGPRAIEPGARVSPIEANKTEEDGQRTTEESCVAAAHRLLRMLGSTVNKRGETAQRAANDFMD
jgi:hypothetical protein